MDMKDMVSAIRDMPKVEEMMKSYTMHLDLLKRLVQELSANKIQKLFLLEQSIISGLIIKTDPQGKSKGEKADNTFLVKQVS